MINKPRSGEIRIYTDGSCHTQKRTGAWVAILVDGREKIILEGSEINTTHNRMELMAVIKAIEYVSNNKDHDTVIQIVTDSQYVMGLPDRAGKLTDNNFVTKKGKDLQNTDLLKIFFNLFASHSIHLNKIRAHQKANGRINYNMEADKLSRSIMRRAL